MSDSFFGIVHLPTYIIGTVLVILLPGPNSLFVLSTAAHAAAVKTAPTARVRTTVTETSLPARDTPTLRRG